MKVIYFVVYRLVFNQTLSIYFEGQSMLYVLSLCTGRPTLRNPEPAKAFNVSGFQMSGIWIPTVVTLFTHKLNLFF